MMMMIVMGRGAASGGRGGGGGRSASCMPSEPNVPRPRPPGSYGGAGLSDGAAALLERDLSMY